MHRFMTAALAGFCLLGALLVSSAPEAASPYGWQKASISDMQALGPAAGTSVQSVTVNGSQGAGMAFNWVSGALPCNAVSGGGDGGTTFCGFVGATSATGYRTDGYWQRQWGGGWVDAPWFNANVANADNLADLQAAVNTGLAVHLPGVSQAAGVKCYAVSAALKFNGASGQLPPQFYGDGQSISRLCPTASNTEGIMWLAYSGVNIQNGNFHDFGITQNGVTGTPYGLILGNGAIEANLMNFHNIEITGFTQTNQAGIYLLSGFDDHWGHMNVWNNYYNVYRPDVASPEQVTTQYFDGGDNRLERATGPASVYISGPMANLTLVDTVMRDNAGDAVLWTQSTNSASWAGAESFDCDHCFFEVNNTSNTGTGELDLTSSTPSATNYFPLRVRIMNSQFHTQTHAYPQLKLDYVRATVTGNVGLASSGLVTTANSKVAWRDNALLNASATSQQGTFTGQLGSVFTEDNDYFFGWEYLGGNMPVQFGQGVKGKTDGILAGAGNWGQILSCQTGVTPVNAAATATYFDLCNIPLTAGTWWVSGFVTFKANAATLTPTENACIGTASGTASTGCTLGDTMAAVDMGTTTYATVPVFKIVNISASQIQYLKGIMNYSAGAPQAYGKMTAMRMPS